MFLTTTHKYCKTSRMKKDGTTKLNVATNVAFIQSNSTNIYQ